MPDVLVIALFGLPGVLASLSFSAIGIARRNLLLCVLGALFVVPFSYYLSGNPGIGRPGLIMPFFQLGSVWIVRQGGPTWLAWALLLPLVLIAGLVFT